jgi:hypothetical protein
MKKKIATIAARSCSVHREEAEAGRRRRLQTTAATQRTIYGESDLQVTNSSPGLSTFPWIFFSEIAELQLVPWQHRAHEQVEVALVIFSSSILPCPQRNLHRRQKVEVTIGVKMSKNRDRIVRGNGKWVAWVQDFRALVAGDAAPAPPACLAGRSAMDPTRPWSIRISECDHGRRAKSSGRQSAASGRRV